MQLRGGVIMAYFIRVFILFMRNENCWWLDAILGLTVLEVTTLSAAPQRFKLKETRSDREKLNLKVAIKMEF